MSVSVTRRSIGSLLCWSKGDRKPLELGGLHGDVPEHVTEICDPFTLVVG